MTARNRRGGFGRPVDLFRRVLASVAVAIACLTTVAAGSVAAHGGVPILQAVVERVNPGGTLDLMGDMTSEGSVEILLVAPAEAVVWHLAPVEADHEGHFRAFLVVPADVPAGDYRVRATMATEEASTMVVVAGPPIVEGGELPGQDEALAGVPPDLSKVSPSSAGALPALAPERAAGPDIGLAAAALALGVALAAVLGVVARTKSGRRART